MSSAPSLDAALRALPGAGADAAGLDVAATIKAHVARTREHLAELHRSSESGRVVNEANSDLTDRLVRRLFSLAEEKILADGGALEAGLCVVAVGGYARREMSIHSDVDLLVLYRDKLSPYVTAVAERLQYWLWDAGVKVGCATRTIRATVKLGRQDATVRTAVLTARFICGDGEFFHQFADTIRRELLPDPSAFIVAQAESMRQRHAEYGESLFLLQPNLKEGAGALRDYHTAYWVARGAQPSLRDLDDLLHFGLLTESEMDQYRAALDFLWRARNALHLQSARANDQMSFELQEQIAESLGYATDAGAELPVERFMRDYYRHARAIQNYSELVIEQCAARASRSAPRRRVKDVEDGFRIASGHLEIPHAAHLRNDPVRLIRAFHIAQLHDVPLSRMARRLVRENLELIDEAFLGSDGAREAFFDVLGAEHRVMRTLMEMNEVGLLAAYLPEWEHIVCRWQHVIYHTYTVDVHSIFLVEELRRLGKSEYRDQVPDLTELIATAADRPTLFLGCLLHDIGKGFGGDHSNRGVERARACLDRMNLEPARAERVLFLVQQHLRMSHLAQRRDLSDPKLIFDFARLCGDRENLRNLYLLTFADIRASSRQAWNDWKGQLLRELFERSSELLETGAEDADKAIELIEARVEVRREGAAAELRKLGIADGTSQAFFDVMPRRYFVSHTPRQIARHAAVMLRYTPEVALVTAFREMRADFTEFILCTADVHGLYATVAGVLMSRGWNILASHVYTTRDGLAVEIYRLATPRGGPDERALEWETLEKSLGRVLRNEVSVSDLLKQVRRPFGTQRPPSRAKPTILISNDESDFYTLIDITANDRIGLLYDLTDVIARHDGEIYISKAATIMDQAADTFYVKDRQGGKIRDTAVLEALERDLLAVTERAESSADG